MKINKTQLNSTGMTLIEVLLVISLIAMVSIAIYNSFSIGIKVWEKSQLLVLEEDVVIFFDKITRDLQNTYQFSDLKIEGSEFKFSFPTIIYTIADRRMGLNEGEYIEQLGQVEYFYDFNENKLFKREANYGQALREEYSEPKLLVESVNSIKFRYYNFEVNKEIYKTEVLDELPDGVEIEIEFSDKQGERVMKRFIDVPVSYEG